MKLYLIIISVCSLIIAAIVSICYEESFLITRALVAFAVVLQILIDAMVATFARLLPKKCANYRWKAYRVSAREKRGYERLKIRSWKDKIPETGALLKIFDKTKVENPEDPVYLATFLQETAYAEVMHEYSAVLVFVLLLFAPGVMKWTIALPVILVNFFLQILN